MLLAREKAAAGRFAGHAPFLPRLARLAHPKPQEGGVGRPPSLCSKALPEAIWIGRPEQRQRSSTLEEERQVPEIAGERHLEQLGGLEARDRVHPASRRSGIERLPEQAEREP